ncbi:MAG: hypothetical protein RSC43_00995 [Clostridia bacterium]
MFMKAVILSKTAIGDNKHVFQSHNLIQLHYRTVHIGGIRISQAIVVDIKNIYPKLAYEGDFMFIATPANERQFSRALEHISGVVEYYFEHNRAGVVEPKYQ